jgi:pimeloyl-ACP methyl ester carboxylesterase
MLILVALLGGMLTSAVLAEPTSRSETVSAPDKFPIRFTYYPAVTEKDKNPEGPSESGVIILLHGDKGSRNNWDKETAPAGQKTFPALLQEQGYAVVSVDLRKHGQSVLDGQEELIQTDDYLKMAAGDLKAVKDFIQTEHQAKNLNMGKMAVIGVGFSAPVAAAFSQFDWEQPPHDDSPVASQRTARGQDVKALVLLSPDATAGRLSLNKSLVYLTKQNLAFLLIAGKLDPADKGAAKIAFRACGGGTKKTENRAYLFEPDMKYRGTDMFGKTNQAIENTIVKFLELHIKKISVPWVDRRSRLDR